jgi:hypothetical protein
MSELRDISHIIQRLVGTPRPGNKGNGQQPPPIGIGNLIDLGRLDAEIAELIEHGTENGEPPEHRGEKFYKVVRRLHEAGHSFVDVLLTLEDYPDGVQDKYISEHRLKKHLWKLWQKLDAGEDPGDEFDDEDAGQPITSDDEPWPDRSDQAVYNGLAGEIVKAVEPHSEADPMAMLVHFLIFFGNVIGRGPYYQIGRTKHGTNLNALVIGETSEGRKGTAKDDMLPFIQAADITWMKRCKPGGLVSGEGLIWHVRDDRDVYNRRTQKMETVKGVADKRLMIIESEYSNVLAMVERKGNSLPGVLRQMFDDHYLTTLAKNEPAEATGVHGSMISHTTPTRLRQVTKTEEIEDGSINRNLLICSRRSKELPFPGDINQDAFDDFVDRIRDALDFARKIGRVFMTKQAAADYRPIYSGLLKRPPGLLTTTIKRGPVLIIRLALIYALLDQRREIDREHLKAAVAIWNYAEASARHVFGDVTGNAVADDILYALRRAGPKGRTRTELRGLFSNHIGGVAFDRALRMLQASGRAKCVTQSAGGRPREDWMLA